MLNVPQSSVNCGTEWTDCALLLSLLKAAKLLGKP